jgi:tetratricopeptide (TPR) repeat protein
VNFQSQTDKDAFLRSRLRRPFSIMVGCRTSRGLIFPCLVFLLIAIAGRSTAQELDPWTLDHFTRAVQAQHANDLATAESEYRLVTSRNPRFAGAYLNLGIVDHQQKKYTDAVSALKTAVLLDPHVLGSQLFLGIDEYLTWDFKGAAEHLRTALAADPKDRQAGVYLGLDLLALDQPFPAIAILRETSKYHPGDSEILYHLGQAHLEAAQEGITHLGRLGQQSPLYFWSLAIAAQQKKDTVGILENSMKALALDPYIAELYFEIASILQQQMPELSAASRARYQSLCPDSIRMPQKKDDGAEVEIDEANQRSLNYLWRRIQEIHPSATVPAVADSSANQFLAKQMKLPGNAQLRAALHLYEEGRYEEAAKELASAGASTSNWSLAYLKALSYERGGDQEEAERVFTARLLPYMDVPSVSFLATRIEGTIALKSLEDILDAKPDSYTAKLLLGRYHAAEGKQDLALAEYQEALKLAPQQPGIHLAIAEVYSNQLQWPRAIEEYQAELALDPANNIALAELGHAMTEAHDANNAGPVLRQALHADPGNAKAYTDLGKVCEMQGESEKAIQAYESALRYDPSQLNLHYKLSRLYQKQGQTEQANKELAAFREAEAQQQKNMRKAMEALQAR